MNPWEFLVLSLFSVIFTSLSISSFSKVFFFWKIGKKKFTAGGFLCVLNHWIEYGREYIWLFCLKFNARTSFMLYNKQMKWELRQQLFVSLSEQLFGFMKIKIDATWIRSSSIFLIPHGIMYNCTTKNASQVIKQEQSRNQKLQYNNVQFFNLCHATLLLYSCSTPHSAFLNNMHLIEAGRGNFVQVNGGYVTRRIAFVLDRPIMCITKSMCLTIFSI